MRRLICAFVVFIWHKQVFSWRGSIIEFLLKIYCNDPKFSDRYSWANSKPRSDCSLLLLQELSEQGLWANNVDAHQDTSAIPSASFGCITAGAFLTAWPTGVQLLVFFRSSVPVVLFDIPGISRCRSQHVSVESSSLFHHSIYLWFICFPWCSIDELENLHVDQTTVCFEPWQKRRARLGSHKTGLSPLVF